VKNKEIEELYKYKREILKKVSPSKNEAEGSRVWEALPASERQKLAGDYYDYCLNELKKVDKRIKELEEASEREDL